MRLDFYMYAASQIAREPLPDVGAEEKDAVALFSGADDNEDFFCVAYTCRKYVFILGWRK